MNSTILDSFPTDTLGSIVSHTAISNGMSGATVFSVETTQGHFVLRRYHGAQKEWRRTTAIQRLVAEHGIAPALLYVDEDNQTTVSQKINGVSFGSAMAAPASQQAALHSLTSILGKLHALPYTNAVARNLGEASQTLWTKQSQRRGFVSWAANLESLLHSCLQIMIQDGRTVLSHGDLNPANILWDGSRVWLVDWDMADLSHPYLDLASIANFLSFSNDTAIALLGLQEQSKISDQQAITFNACRNFARITYGCVFLELVPKLDEIQFDSLERTPTLMECFGRIMKGEIQMSSPSTQALIASALFKQALA